MKNFKQISWILLILFFTASIQAQTIVSEKSSLFISNKPKVQEKTRVVEPVAVAVVADADKTKPTINIITPSIEIGSVYKTEEAKLTLMGNITDESGISYVAVNSKLQQMSGDGTFVTDIELSEGMNTIPIMAVDKENNLRKIELTIEYYIPRVTLADKIKEESIYYGLIIGVQEYNDHRIPDLSNPVRDANNLKDALLANYTFEEENITLIENATYEQIGNAFDALSGKVTEKDNLLIFYAGHGWWDADANNGYWLPADAKEDSKSFWFRNSTLVDYLKEVKSKHTLLITDACFGGSIFSTRSAFSDTPKAFERLYEKTSRQAMTSGNLSEVPDESAFCKYLVDNLNKNEEEYLSSEQLFSSFRIGVMNNSDADPQYGIIRNVDDNGGEFLFIKK
jgi:hypothetical protein